MTSSQKLACTGKGVPGPSTRMSQEAWCGPKSSHDGSTGPACGGYDGGRGERCRDVGKDSLFERERRGVSLGPGH